MVKVPKLECETCDGPRVRLSFCPDCQTQRPDEAEPVLRFREEMDARQV